MGSVVLAVVIVSRIVAAHNTSGSSLADTTVSCDCLEHIMLIRQT
jgi:hypothetical protein